MHAFRRFVRADFTIAIGVVFHHAINKTVGPVSPVGPVFTATVLSAWPARSARSARAIKSTEHWYPIRPVGRRGHRHAGTVPLDPARPRLPVDVQIGVGVRIEQRTIDTGG